MQMNKYLSVYILFFLLLASGCLKNDWEELEKHEKELIQQYLNANGISADTKTEGGIYFIEEAVGTGLTPKEGDYVVIDFTGRYLETNEIHETTDSTLKDEWAAANNFTYYLFGPAKFQAGHSIAGINEGLSLMKEGGKVKLIIPSDKAFYNYVPFVYEIELIKVINDPVAYEDSVLNLYRAANGFNANTKFDSIWLKETVTPDPGDTHTIEINDTVFFWYTGRLMDAFTGTFKDDRIFNSNIGDDKPVKYVFGKTSVISGSILSIPEGLKMALDTMRDGTHARALIPYTVAFGRNGLIQSQQRYTIVPNYQTVIYDLIVEDIHSP